MLTTTHPLTHPPPARLRLIAERQRRSRLRDALFACFITLAAILGATTLGTTMHGVLAQLAQR